MRTLLLTLTTCLFVLPATAKSSGGTGEPNDPYQIATAADLIALGEDPNDYNKHFVLTADIDLDPNLPGRKVFDKAVIAPDVDEASEWVQGTPFTGVFDGGDHTISHLTIRGARCVGLFGILYSTSGVNVKDLAITDVDVCGTGEYVGGLVGQNSGRVARCYTSGLVTGKNRVGGVVGLSTVSATVSQCHSSAKVNGTGYHIGGLVGENRDATITECFSTGIVTGDRAVGGLAGGSSGAVTGCYSTSLVTGMQAAAWGRQGCVGGLIGDNWGQVARSYSTGVVRGGSAVGGLVGQNYEAEVTQCYSTGAVIGTGESIGGLVGDNMMNSEVTDSYSTGAVAGEGDPGWSPGYVGGLVGRNRARVTRCYSVGSVAGARGVGGLVGYRREPGGTVAGCFWDVQTSGQVTSADGAGKTTAEMQTAQTFLDAAWDFVGETANGSDDIWKIAEGLGYPRLSWEKYSGGTGEPNDPYRIATAEDLIALGNEPNDYDKHFILTADIDLDPNLPGRKVFDKAVIAPAGLSDGDFGGEGEPPFTGTPFAGVLDGNGHTIRGLTIKGDSHLGLFGAAFGEVRDVMVVDVRIIGSGCYVGGIAGRNGGSITDSYTAGNVAGNLFVGGLTGTNGYCWGGGMMYRFCSHGVVSNCHSVSAVTGAGHVGGLVGSNAYGTITSCHSSGTVNSTGDYVGGLVGCNEEWDPQSGAVTQCYSTGAVSGNYYVGGLVGCNLGGHVVLCYSTGAVSGNYDVGGLVGENWGDVSQCNSTGVVSGDTHVGGLVGENAGPVVCCYSTGRISGNQSVGGLVGFRHWGDWGTTAACFWDTQTSGQATSDEGTGKTTAEMHKASTFLAAGWDFVGETANGTEDIWWILEGKDYPKLWWEAAEK